MAFVSAAVAVPASGAGESLDAAERSLGGVRQVGVTRAMGEGRSLGVRKSRVGISGAPSATKPYWACPEGPCDAIIDPPPVSAGAGRFALPAGGPRLEGGGEKGGLDPQDLRSAYSIPRTGGSDQTVAIVDAYGYREAEKDLAVYRERYGLPPCTKANGCFHKVNQAGEEGNYPRAEEGWETESALDLDMASAACPECHVVLVEANTASGPSLSTSVNTAAKFGATEISNSWGSPEQHCGSDLCAEEQEAFNHPGVLITAAGGDSGYNNAGIGAASPEWPASLPTVVAVGGTSLHRAQNPRGWTEGVWGAEAGRNNGTGSGCSRFPKPPWQLDTGCPGRMTTDVSAVGACETPVSVYNIKGWSNICGTSASTPLVAAIEAHSSEFARTLPGADAFYQDIAALNDVTVGSNGACKSAGEHEYFCMAGPGYDGPTGNGTPNGPLELNAAAPTAVTKPASEVTATSATLNASVSPQGFETTYHFEYGPTDGYGSAAPVPDGAVGATGQSVMQHVAGLTPEQVYHFRVVATSSAGVSYGTDSSFVTERPSVSAIAPSSGPAVGGQQVTITGTGLLGAVAVHFGARPALSYTVESEGSIIAVAPAGLGAVDITVTTPAGTTPVVSTGRFVYDQPGPVLSWGKNDGQLGNGATSRSSSPVEVAGLGEVTAVSEGLQQSLALLPSGRVMAWGENEFGQVGDGTRVQKVAPVPVCAVGVSECPNGPYLENVTAISAGFLHSLALLSDGTVVAWGGNLYGSLGAHVERSPVPVAVCMSNEETCKPEHRLAKVQAIAAGAAFSMALLDDGTVVSWGDNARGQLGLGSTSGPESCSEEPVVSCSRIPVPAGGLNQITSLSAGFGNTLALTSAGTVLAWGENAFGELGTGSKTSTATPTPVCPINAKKAACTGRLAEVTAVAAGYADGFALLRNGTVASWGRNQEGQLGSGTPGGPKICEKTFACSRTPVPVAGLHEVSAISSGVAALDTMAVLRSGRLLTWGDGVAGELGDGLRAESETPVGVCQVYSEGPCPSGPYLTGEVVAMAAGRADLLGLHESPRPVIVDVQPNTGPATGGTTVTIIGAKFTAATSVNFGSSPASEIHIHSADELTAVTPPGTGAVDVTVTTPQGASSTTADDRFTYRSAPAATTGTASLLARNSATLNGEVVPDGDSISDCHFEYGTTPEYGASAPCSSLPPSTTQPAAVAAAVTGLQANTTYYYRLAASNSLGEGHGEQQTFRTELLPELGRCIKVTGASNGRYLKSGCTTLSAGQNTGKYEWHSWPLANNHFTETAATSTFETARAETVRCAQSSMTGEYTGAQSMTASLTLRECKYLLFNTSCQTAGATNGEIKSSLDGELGSISRGSKPSAGWNLKPTSGEQWATAQCAGIPISLTGSVIAPVTPLDKMASQLSLTAKGSAGLQSPPAFEDGLEANLILNALSSSPAALSMSGTLSIGEPAEIKSLP